MDIIFKRVQRKHTEVVMATFHCWCSFACFDEQCCILAKARLNIWRISLRRVFSSAFIFAYANQTTASPDSFFSRLDVF